MPDPNRLPTDLTAADLDSCELWAANETRLARAAARARAGRRVRLVVLGTSPTSGCGSAEDVAPGGLYGARPQHNRSVGMSRMCDPSRSWGRHLADFLGRQLGPGAPDVEVAPKNAAAAASFARCTSSGVPRNTDIVLLEVLTNVSIIETTLFRFVCMYVCIETTAQATGTRTCRVGGRCV